MQLRSYQVRALTELGEAFKSGAKAPLLVSPPGSGKTVMLSRVVSGHVAKGGTVNWYAHRRELCTQAENTLRGFGLNVGGAAPVHVTSVQTALSKGEVRGASFNVFDEAHHFAADDWSRLTTAHAGGLMLGATATPERADGRGLDMFDRLIVVAQTRELIAAGHLVPFEVLGPSRTLGKGRIAQTPVDAYCKYGRGRRNVVFAPHVKAAHEYRDGFAAKGIRSFVLHGGLSSGERDYCLQQFVAGEIRVLINVYILTEGWDCPATEVVTIARSVGSATMWIQATARAGRPHPGKTGCTILDLRGAVHQFGRPDADREYTLDGVGITCKGVVMPRACRICKKPLEDGVTVCSECGYEMPELETPKATGEELRDWKETIRKDSDDKRVERLAKWIHLARTSALAQGKRGPELFRAITSSKYKFAGVYGSKPDEATWKEAMRKAGAG